MNKKGLGLGSSSCDEPLDRRPHNHGFLRGFRFIVRVQNKTQDRFQWTMVSASVDLLDSSSVFSYGGKIDKIYVEEI